MSKIKAFLGDLESKLGYWYEEGQIDYDEVDKILNHSSFERQKEWLDWADSKEAAAEMEWESQQSEGDIL